MRASLILSLALAGCADDAHDPEIVFLVRGPLADADLGVSRRIHDESAATGEQAARDLGDFGHDVLLGTTFLGTAENEFLAVDRWDNAEGSAQFYGDPELQRALGTLLSAPPAVDSFVSLDWHGWGDLDAGDAFDPHYWVIIRGQLAAEDLDEARQGHDEAAAAGEGTARALGDVAHRVYFGAVDDRELLIVDVWSDSDDIATFYSDPAIQGAFGALFASPPTIAVYGSTDWHQW